MLVSRSTVATLALALLLVAGMAPFIDIDVWHEMSLFREMLRQGWIPYIDRFAYTPTISPTVRVVMPASRRTLSASGTL